MVCKKCGMDLIEGIDICPYCGEDNKKEENNVNNIMDVLNDLKMEVSEKTDEVVKTKEIELDNTKEKELLESIDKEIPVEVEENTNFYSSLNEVNTESTKIDSIPLPNIDDYLNKSFEEKENKKEEAKEEHIPNILDILNKETEGKEAVDSKEIINIDEVINQIKELDTQIDNDTNNTEQEQSEKIEILDKNENSNSNNEINIQKEISETDNEATKNIEENKSEELTDKIQSQNIINIDDLINDLKEIPVEETTETKELTSKIIEQPNDINAIMDDIKKIEVDGITPLEMPKKEIKEEKEENKNESPIKNDYLITNNIPNTLQEDNNESLKQDIEVPNIDEELPKEEVKQEENISEDDNKLRLKESKLKVDLPIQEEKQPSVYINPALENIEPPKMPDIPVVLPPKEEIENNTTQATPILMPQDIQQNIPQEAPNNTQEKMPTEPKKSGNSSAILLFMCMIVLGVLVALVVSYIFNM